MIPQDTIDQIRQASDIVQIIGEYLRLKKRGKNYLGLCPFHTEKTASFSVSPEKQIYYCFGCGKGGNVFTFLQEHETMSFVEAVRHLAQKTGIAIREDARSDHKREVLDRISYANQVALEYFQETLAQPRYRSIYEDYLQTKRQMSPEVIRHFKLGLAGEAWDGLIRYAARKDLTAEDLDRAKLALQSEKTHNYFDRFRHRLMIPIFNLSQKPIAFGGRTLKKGEPAKYVNSPETPLYVKGSVLYGLNIAKDTIRKQRAAIVVEGYFDLISLWQIGVRNVVASSGTAFTAQQAHLLARFAEEVYLFFDADSAGHLAALRSVDTLYDAGLEVKVITAPPDEDPDSIAIKYGRDKVDELTDSAVGFIPFRLRGLDIGSAGIIGKEKLVKEFASLGARIADSTRRTLFNAEAASALGVDVNVLQRSASGRHPDADSYSPHRRKYNPNEFEFLSLLFNSPGAIDTIVESVSPDDFDSKELSRVYAAIITQYRNKSLVDANTLVEGLQDSDFVSLVTEIASKDWPPENVESETGKALERILSGKKKRIRTRLQEELAAAEADGNHEKADRLLKEIKSYGLDADKPRN